MIISILLEPLKSLQPKNIGCNELTKFPTFDFMFKVRDILLIYTYGF